MKIRLLPLEELCGNVFVVDPLEVSPTKTRLWKYTLGEKLFLEVDQTEHPILDNVYTRIVKGEIDENGEEIKTQLWPIPDKPKFLKAEYTLELAEEIVSIHGLDAEKELANMLSEQIKQEIDNEIIRTLYNNEEVI